MLPGNKMLQVRQQPAEEARILLAEDSIRDRNVGAGTHLTTDGGKSDTPLALRLLAAVAEPERYVIFSKVVCFILIFSKVVCSFIKLFSPQSENRE